jgi:tetratricopeptide (TPR) repeat protein
VTNGSLQAWMKTVSLFLVAVALAVGCGRSTGQTQRKDLESDPGHHYRWAYEQYLRGYYLEALESINKAIGLEPGEYLYYNMRGLIYHSAGEPDRALADFEKVLEINPYYTDVHNNIGATYVEMGRTDEALAEFEIVLRDPMYRHKEKAHYNVGNLYFARQMHEEAIEHYRKAVAIKPDYLRAHYRMGMALRELGQMEEARREFEEVVRIAPQSDEAREVQMILDAGEPTS